MEDTPATPAPTDSTNDAPTPEAPVATAAPAAAEAPAAEASTPTAAPAERPGRGGQRGGGGPGQRRGGRRGAPRNRDSEQSNPDAPVEITVQINRCSKVRKGGRTFSFSALIVVGDRKGKVGIGFGKANEVPDAIRKATDAARKQLETVCLKDATLPHEAYGEYDGARVLLRPASPGTGLIAGGGVRAVLEAAGVKDVLAKSLGSNNPINMVKAALAALRQMRGRDHILRLRGKRVKSASPAEAPAAVAA